MLRTIHVSESNQNSKTIQLIKDISLANYARPKRAVEEEIAGRQKMFSAKGGSLDISIQKKHAIRPGVAPLRETQEGWNDW